MLDYEGNEIKYILAQMALKAKVFSDFNVLG